MNAKRAVEIEKLLHWAYRDELPKRQTSSAEGIWDKIRDNGSLGGINPDPGHGAAQRYPHFGLPHRDAETIEKAVSALPDLIIDWELSRAAIMGDLLELLTRRDVLMTRSLKTAALVTMHSKMGTRPEWQHEPPAPFPSEPEHGDKSKPKIVGECRGRNLYTTGSYCPLTWRPSPISIAIYRADYACWYRGLERLAAELVLEDHEVLPPAAPALPWSENEPPKRIFQVGERPKGPPLPLKPQRDRMLGVKRRPLGSAVRYPLDDR